MDAKTIVTRLIEDETKFTVKMALPCYNGEGGDFTVSDTVPAPQRLRKARALAAKLMRDCGVSIVLRDEQPFGDDYAFYAKITGTLKELGRLGARHGLRDADSMLELLRPKSRAERQYMHAMLSAAQREIARDALKETAANLIEDDSDAFGPEDRQEPIDWSKVKAIKKVPAGAKRVHMYPAQDVLRPRGSMQKESLSADLAQRLRSAFENWTDQSYGDSLSPEKALSVLEQNFKAECDAAWQAFVDQA